MAQGNGTPPSGTSYDVIIIGGGTIGLSAAYYAAARGLDTLLLEQFGDFADAHASSGGFSRIFRIMYSPPYMAQLAETAYALWHEIQNASGVDTILWKQSLVFEGISEPSVEGNLGDMKTILANLGAPYQWYGSGGALAQAFPAFAYVPDAYVGLVQPDSAVIRTKTSVEVFRTLAGQFGATLLTGQQAAVTTISTEGPYQVSCAAGTYSAGSLILCPSAWTNQVLQPFGLELDLTIWQMTLAYFEVDGTYDYPLWYEFGPTVSNQAQLFYGFPPDEMPGYIKASADFTNTTFTDPSQCTYTPDPAILSQLGTFLQQRFNGVSATGTNPATCLYTMSGDNQMVLDRLGFPGVAIFTGDSGRGFKFTPLFGRILVDLATTGKTYYDISPFSITRPGIIKAQRGATGNRRG
jgi:monomeric sarcosine oxidase